MAGPDRTGGVSVLKSARISSISLRASSIGTLPPHRLLYRMTIHTKWMELLRKEASEAFHYGELTARVDASFIDGQIKLMISESTQTW
jgi:hypothetical protein